MIKEALILEIIRYVTIFS